MENSLRNHALVQQQNQQQHRNREEYYRNNGIIRSSSASAAPASSSHHGNSSINISSNRSRNSGSSTSGKGSKSSTTGSSRSTRSGEGSDEAVQGPVDSNAQKRYHNDVNLHQQQHYHYGQHHHQQQRYPQHHQYYHNSGFIGIAQQDQYGYPISNDSVGSSQQSSNYHRQYIGHQQHYAGQTGGSAAEGTASSQSHYSNILGSISGSATSNPSAEEAYRRVGQRLSWSAHGGDSNGSRPSIHGVRMPSPRLGFKSPFSCFKPFEESLQTTIRERDREDIASHGNSSRGSGSAKSGSAKTGSANSKKSSNGKKSGKANITRKMTLSAGDLFKRWYSDHTKMSHHQKHRRRKSGNGVSRPSSRSGRTERSSGRDDISPRFGRISLGDNNMLSNSTKNQHSSLTAVIESASQNSSTTRSTPSSKAYSKGGGSVRSEDKSRSSSTIATRSSIGTRNSLRSFGTLPPRGKCLTQPSEGVSNDNLCDNVEGNLIVYENDYISIPKKQVCVLTQGKIPRGASSSDFRVQSLLGQGTFAQVFRCLHVQTGQLVAVKIVKNKPAYTRQAAVEIDVIRALTTTPNGTNGSRKNTKNSDGKKDRSKSNGDMEGSPQNDASDYMIDMVCYFLYKDHLCLVFELLGLNLYEVLKKRQFRGLPLAVTQTLVRQAVLGSRCLAEKSIVHCDLKPENILLVDEDDAESVMSAGESRRHQSSNTLSVPSRDKKSAKEPNLPPPYADSNPKKIPADGSIQNIDHEPNNEGQTQSSDTTKSTNDTDSTNKLAKQQGKTEAGHSSDNSKSTTETDNTMKKREQQQPSTAATAPTTTAVSRSSTEEKNNLRPSSKSPMESTIATNETQSNPVCSHKIKLIDFGSACFEGQMSHTYIQSRFYRSPEVLLGLAYDSAIDMWSLGCVAAELFLGLPILPGVHEHDQLGRIIEMIGDIPDWMLDQGSKSSKYFGKYVPSASSASTQPIQSSTTTPEGRSGSTEAATSGRSGSEAPRPLPQWRIKSQHEYIASLSQNDIEKKGGLAKLQRQPGNRYFKRKLLSDIILHKGQSGKQEDLQQLKAFIHFLYGILDPDPWKRWTAFQVASHPFFTGAAMQENTDPSKIKDDNHANRLFNLYWEAPTDSTIYRRKLLNVQKTREKQQAARRSFGRGHGHSRSRSVSPSSQDGLPNLRNLFSKNNNQGDDTNSVTSHTDDAINQAATRYSRPGSYQGFINVSSSMTQFGSNQGIQVLAHNATTQIGFSGPQSFSESGNSVGLPGSFNEVDFALALHRPGVVPMGDSVTTATTSTTSMSSGNNSRSTSIQSSTQIQAGSYGSHQVLQYTNHQLRFASESAPRTSRSFGEGDHAPANSTAIPTVIDPRHQHVMYASSQESGIGIRPPVELKPQTEIRVDSPLQLKGENIPKRPASATSTKNAGQLPPESIPTASSQVTDSKSVPSYVQQSQNFGVYDNPQVYQQQLAMMQQQFHQQQLLLQQQQAALALQQEQLRAYYTAAGINPQQFGIPGASTTPTATINAQQLGIPGAPTTPVSSTNPQQFALTGASAATINTQQYGLSSTAQGPLQAAGLNAHQYSLAGTAAPVQGGGYYVLPTVGGSHMILPSNQGVALPVSGQLPGITPLPGILPGQLPGLHAAPAQIQGLASTGLPAVGVPPGSNVAGLPEIQGMAPVGLSSVGVPPSPAVSGMPGIQGVHPGGGIPPVAGVPGVGTTGITNIAGINSHTSPAASGPYTSSNKQQQQHLHRQP